MKPMHSPLFDSRARSSSRRPALVLAGALLGLAACHDSGGTSASNNVVDDADLAALALSAGPPSPAFDPDTLDYSLDTLSGVDVTTVTAITSDPDATLAIDGTLAVSGSPQNIAPLSIGSTLIRVEVTSENGLTTKAYTVEVVRPPFQVVSISVLQGSILPVNQEIVFRFNEDVDFATVSANTIQIATTIQIDTDVGRPAVGVFELRDSLTVVFRPNCPTREDLADTGLEAGGVAYTLRVPGRDSGAVNTVRSKSGGVVETTQVRNFQTADFGDAFLDFELGPPVPVVREQGSLEPNATYLELGGDPDKRVYFERAPNREIVLSVPGFEAPLSLYGDASSRVAVVIAFNQPIHPASSNLSRLKLEFQEDAFRTRTIEARATLVANCDETGAKVRLEPSAILPQAALVRAVVSPGFQDLAGEVNLIRIDDFALVPTTTIELTSLTPVDEGSDEVLEGFDFGGDSPLSLQDTEAVFDVPAAEWSDGRLSAAFQFDGTGGPNGDFDWVVRAGELFFFDTTRTSIDGGPNGVPVTTIVAVNGVVDLRNLTIQSGGTIRVQGPNPMRIQATGEVRIEGLLDLSGFNAKDVATLNTGNQTELGGAGQAGGGKGGSANDNTAGPTPRGGRGQGPFGQGNLGGQGGEMGFHSLLNKNARRPGGGGGGRFTRDWIGSTTFAALSLAAGPGSDGNPSSTGAETGLMPARGGTPGQGPFLDANDGNDFFGVRPVVTNGELTALVRGELAGLWAGHGGGGGGNAGRFFPNPNWNFASDEKGGGGGGGAGGLHVKALGRIVFGLTGQIVANGGRGGSGENTNFLDHIGGTGGGGSGGHVVLESATAVDFTDGGVNVGAPLRDFVLAAGPLRKTGVLTDVDTCTESPSFCCPSGCGVNSNGGAGGAGLIQIHVPDPTQPPDTVPSADIIVPAAALLAADVLDQVTSPPAYVMMPSFGSRSMARSKWISIGEADREPGGTRGLVKFLFGGIETSGVDDGKIQATSELVSERTPLLQGDLEGSATVTILADGVTLAFRGSALDPLFNGTTSGFSNDLYLRSPALLREFVLRIDAGTTAGDFVVAHADYDEGNASAGDEELRIMVAVGALGTPQAFFAAHVGEPGVLPYLLIPRFFRVVTAGTENLLPSTAFVRIQFQAAAGDGLGGVDEQNPLVDWTGDIARFNALTPGTLRFFRFQVEFDLAANGQGLSADTDPVTLDFLRIPFVF